MDINLKEERAGLHSRKSLHHSQTIDQKIETLLDDYFDNTELETKVRYGILYKDGYILVRLLLGSLNFFFMGSPIDLYRFLLTKRYELSFCRSPRNHFFLRKSDYLFTELVRSKFSMTNADVGKVGLSILPKITKI